MNFREVFTPTDQPTVTYVKRNSKKLEQNLRDYLETPNAVVSISGPSKTGKTVLLRRVVDPDLLIPLTGAAIRSIDDFWRGILAWMEAPESRTIGTSSATSVGGAVSGGGEVGLPLVAKGSVEGSATASTSASENAEGNVPVDPFAQVVKDIGKSEFIVFVDDFHYIPKAAQVEIARAIKALAESGVRICTASVPHRNEDVVRANSELRGRLAAIDIPDWDEAELSVIAQKGFDELNADFSPSVFRRLAGEAYGSPQLMQALCMNLCRVANLREAMPKKERLEVDETSITETLKDASDFANFAKLVQLLHSGPKVHGTERKQFSLTDGTEGDVYRAILLAIASDPPARSFTYDDVLGRVKAVCSATAPVGSSVSGSLGHMAAIAAEHYPDGPVLEWDEDVLTIIDPYFAFYLRASTKLEALGASTRDTTA